MRRLIPTAVLGLSSWLPATAQPPSPPPAWLVSAFEQPTPAQPPAKQLPPAAPKLPDPKAPAEPNPIERAFTNPFARGTEAGGLAARSFNENFDGDNVGAFYRYCIVVGSDPVTSVVGFNQQDVGTTQRQIGTTPRVIGNTQTIIVGGGADSGNVPRPPVVITTPVVVQDPVFALDPVIATTPVTATQQVPRKAVVLLPAASRYSGIQITDNDSPRPTDRLYFGYNFYSDAGASLNPLGGSDIQRQMAGVETTFLGGDASIGLRMLYLQQYGPAGYATQTVGDLSVLFKYAFINNLQTGDVASAGLVVTTPTGGGNNIFLIDGSRLPHSTLFQPWVGGVKMFDSGYVQGITNLIVPTDPRDPTVFGHSVGVGYFLYRNPSAGLLTGVTPRAEVHVRSPFNHRDANGLVYFPDQVNLNGGVTFRFPGASLNAGVSVPVVGPRPWALEAMSYLNVNF
jgi:hypothetical protein